MNITPIEFMAYCKPKNNIQKVSAIYSDGKAIALEDLQTYVSNEFVLMQLTALRSINDEPIYNHMIVKDNEGYYYEVDMFDYVQMFSLLCRKLKIVGNRFQHPELLELCK